MPLLSVLMPLYNEEEFIAEIVKRVLAAPLPPGWDRELVIVDDASKDGSREIVEAIAARSDGRVRLVVHPRNRGKGAAIRTALEHARGEFSLIQDADLEYDPGDYLRLLQPLVEDRADVVYGSRFMDAGERKVLYFWHSLANSLLTTFCNIVADVNLTDMETCYKAFRTSLLQSIPLRSDRFGIEPEMTIKFAKRQARMYETSISYHGRTYEEGKKIGLKDAFQALWIILRYGLTNDLYKDPGAEILDSFSVAPRFNRWMADTIRPYVGRRVMEIGAGMGNLTRQLARGRERYIATDIDAEHLARLEARLHHRANLETAFCDLSKPGHFQPYAASVDTVVCLNVVEHLEDDLLSLRNIHSALQPGGRAIILVPHGQNLFGSLDVVLGHYRRYSHEQLRKRMEEAGFRVEKILDFNRVSRPAWFFNGKILHRKTITRSQLKMFDRTVWIWRRLDSVIPWNPTSIIAIGRKE